MLWLVLGVLLFTGVHLVPITAVGLRKQFIDRLGEGPYKGLFSLDLLIAIVLMVIGWRSTPPSTVYTAPAWGYQLAIPLMFVGLLLFAASGVPTNLKRYLRHPQLTGVATWSVAHLLANGDSRSVVLFGGIGVWAIASMLLLNRRDGAWQKPAPLPLSAEIKPLVGGVIAFALLYFVHPYIAGVAISLG